MRVITALIAGTITPTIIFGIFNGFNIYGLIWAFIVTSIHAVFLGLPAYALLSQNLRMRWITPIVAGFIIGALPFFVFSYEAPNGTYFSNGAYNIVDGVRTPEGWINYYQSVAYAGLFGVTGATAAWLVWRYFPNIFKRNQNPED